ncbi:Nif3-like dinuclear metal center hexameric protein [Maribacter cobaltidurans]|uniref:GTP cyclohydrolase 1 type 2 homolog n=1 Tax=Maribacter cobaltidurans TaxID=1178778 RepID=A0A223V7Q0_9FLAO|nr:Nif3-like dinuclear metal center hexameric protein [Maribacter cobaltidurans]ASV31237.1 Nif3-like dinuclear metal center hexameric protein [Maribacter cobaltidurans]GGD83972.1 GTP cyclohydrolase 1 type 2 [Maribacter cobaltidurans]
MTVKTVAQILEELAPLDHGEDFDNVGLLVGDSSMTVNGILVTLDTIECVVDEAIENDCNLIVSFHPIIFNGLKKITGKNYVERTVLKAIQNNIGIYAIHTALDNSPNGVNAKICEVLGLTNTQILIPKKNTIRKLNTYIPTASADHLKEKLFEAGAGNIGNYSNCSFSLEGTGSFKAGENSNPTIGEIGKTHFETETMFSVTYLKSSEKNILSALMEYHPYEEVAYEIYSLENKNQNLGMGMIGELKEALPEMSFLRHLKKTMDAQVVRHSALRNKPIKKVAVLGGSGAFAIGAAKAAGADVFVTADVKYHQFYEAENKMVIADIGHFETEQFTKNLLVDYLTEKIPNFAVRLSESITNPIKYF